MKKSYLILALISLLVFGFLVGGCGEADEPVSDPVDEPVDEPIDPEDVIVLTYNTQQTESMYDSVHGAMTWMRAVEEATGGRIQFEEYYAETLARGPDAWETTKNGVADISWVFHGYTPGMTSLADVVALPFLEFENAAQTAGVLWKLYEEFPELAGQFDENKILFMFSSPPFFLINDTREIQTIEDLQGLKLRVAGGPPSEAAQALGISPMLVGMPDTYMNIQTGVIDGMAATWDIVIGWNQYEVVKYYTYVPFYTIYFSMAMNWDTWNNLPEDIQDVFTELGGLEGSLHYGINFFEGYDQPTIDLINDSLAQQIRDDGYEINEYTLPNDELDRWVAIAGDPVWEAWVADREAEGFERAQDILDRTLELIETYDPFAEGDVDRVKTLFGE